MPEIEWTSAKKALDPVKISQVVLYMASDLSEGKTGKFFASGNRVAELKIVGPEGLKKDGFTAHDIADAEDVVFLPEDQSFGMTVGEPGIGSVEEVLVVEAGTSFSCRALLTPGCAFCFPGFGV